VGRSASLTKNPRSKRLKNGTKKPKPALEVKSHDQLTTKRGGQSEKMTYAAVALALSRWTRFELNMAGLFAAVAGNSDHTRVGVMLAFGAVRTFEGRAEMLKSAAAWFFSVQTVFSQKHASDPICGPKAVLELQSRYNALAKAGNQFVARRNEIAHGVVNPKNLSKVGKNKWVQLVKPRFVLVPAYFEMSKHNLFSSPKFMYGSEELLHYAKEFERLANEAKSLTTSIATLTQALQSASP
jgi:hypothetical protein